MSVLTILLMTLCAHGGQPVTMGGIHHGPRSGDGFSAGCLVGAFVWLRPDVESNVPDIGTPFSGHAVKKRETYFLWSTPTSERFVDVDLIRSVSPPAVSASPVLRVAFFEPCGVPPLSEAAWLEVLTSYNSRRRRMNVAIYADWWAGSSKDPRMNSAIYWSYEDCFRSRHRCAEMAERLAEWSASVNAPDMILSPQPRINVRVP